MQIVGTIKVIKDIQKVSETFQKREFVITEDSGRYPQHIVFQLTQEKVSMVDQYKQGDRVQLDFDIRGREWTAPDGEVKYFNTLEAWRISAMGQGAPAGVPVAANAAPVAASSSDDAFSGGGSSSEEDDLPF
jgi:hypothetical protein